MKYFFPLFIFLIFLSACSEKPHELLEKCADQRTKLLMPESTQMKLFVLGSESKGMRKITDSLCDECLKIKMSDSLESLNVSNTAAIMMFYVSNINLES